MVYCLVFLRGEFAAFYVTTMKCSARLSSLCGDTDLDVCRYFCDSTIPEND